MWCRTAKVVFEAGRAVEGFAGVRRLIYRVAGVWGVGRGQRSKRVWESRGKTLRVGRGRVS